ncbi:MAG: UbiX family flavin prenyltransferase [Anaerolineales bacterium]
MTKRLIIGLTGASGVIYGIRALEMLKATDIETHLILSPAAKATIAQETDWKVSQVEALASVRHAHRDVGAAIASGSFQTMGMLVAPCSIKTLSAIANSYSNDLISRAADVCLKEGRPVLLMVRETPLHKGHLKLMLTAADAGAIIFPPAPAFYGRPQSIDDLVNGTVGRALARLGIENEAYFRWKGMGESE